MTIHARRLADLINLVYQERANVFVWATECITINNFYLNNLRQGSESIVHMDVGKERELGAEALRQDGWKMHLFTAQSTRPQAPAE